MEIILLVDHVQTYFLTKMIGCEDMMTEHWIFDIYIYWLVVGPPL